MPGRDAHLKKRSITIKGYRILSQSYYGFLAHVQQISPLTFDHLFDFDLVNAYVHSHINELHHRVTIAIHSFLTYLLALTRQYRPNPDLRVRLATLKKTLPLPSPTYNKDDAWVSLATLEEIGKSLWPRKQPQDLRQQGKHPGRILAHNAAMALMLRLWVYRPYRQRNIREMQLEENLHKDAQGKWRITFRSAQLKVATKRGRPNVSDLPFPETLIPLLEEYLTVWRPLLLRKSSQQSAHVFLTANGTPFQPEILTRATKHIVYSYTGKLWHPHIVRTVWATEWIRKTHGDFYTAAIMLNDSLEIVLQKYAHLLEADVAEKADRLIDERNGQGNNHCTPYVYLMYTHGSHSPLLRSNSHGLSSR